MMIRLGSGTSCACHHPTQNHCQTRTTNRTRIPPPPHICSHPQINPVTSHQPPHDEQKADHPAPSPISPPSRTPPSASPRGCNPIVTESSSSSSPPSPARTPAEEAKEDQDRDRNRHRRREVEEDPPSPAALRQQTKINKVRITHNRGVRNTYKLPPSRCSQCSGTTRQPAGYHPAAAP